MISGFRLVFQTYSGRAGRKLQISISMLQSFDSALNKGGQILIISSTFLSSRFWGLGCHKIKSGLKYILEISNIKKQKVNFGAF